jgi:hypothetical protein
MFTTCFLVVLAVFLITMTVKHIRNARIQGGVAPLGMIGFSGLHGIARDDPSVLQRPAVCGSIVQRLLSRKYVFIKSPPGTGKTSMCMLVADEIIRRIPASKVFQISMTRWRSKFGETSNLLQSSLRENFDVPDTGSGGIRNNRGNVS